MATTTESHAAAAAPTTETPVAAAPASSTAAAATGAKTHANASLYVGEIGPEVTEGVLFEIFNQVGPVASIRVCRDTLTRRSLGYAYVNFHSATDAERALDTLNNTNIKGRPCRIMWSQRDPTMRKSGVGNIYIKNLDLNIGHKELHDTFSTFGNILSCKVALNSEGESRGFGFVHFETAEGAENAIQMVNDMVLGDKKVFVTHFVSRKEREQAKLTSWTNVYVKDLDPEVDDEKLTAAFAAHGKVTSAKVMVNAEGASLGFGFVNFELHEEAVKAVEALNGTELGSKKIFAGRAMKKAEREVMLAQKHAQAKQDRDRKYQGINLYIKNIEDVVDEERLKKEFSAFGEIRSLKLVVDEKGVPRGFGFVCFTTPEEAQRAILEMNGRILGGCSKPLYVALHEPREMRRHKLAAQHMQSRAGNYKGQRHFAPHMYPGAPPQVYYPQGGAPGAYMYAPQQMMARGGQRGAWGQQQGYPGPYMMQHAHQQGRGPAPAAGGAGRGGAPPQQRSGGQGGRGGKQAQPQAQAQAPPAQLTVQYLSQFPPEQQKPLIGERIFALVARTHKDLAGKVTGMFLDSAWPLEDLVALTQNEAKLASKIEEAVKVLSEASGAQ